MMDLINGKLLKGQNSISGAGEDRISSLPDSLIHHILSFLNSKWVARTSLLSKRWGHVWTSVPTLDFQVPDSDDPPDTINFMDFVDRTLLLHDSSNIKKFSLCWLRRSNQLNASKINSWISAVVRKNIEEISLLLYQHYPNSIPPSLFTCKSLVTLELNVNPNVCLPNYISFPRLKRLKLCDVRFTDECPNEQLFSSCPVLEDLILIRCTFHMRNFCISSSSLKLLKFENWIDQVDCLRDCSLRIHAPNLVVLTYLSGVPKEFILSTFPTLVEAEVAFLIDVDYCYESSWEQRIGHAATINRFLRALAHVKNLSIHDDALQTLFLSGDQLNFPPFHNLKQLTMTGEVDRDDILFNVLKATPNLESLILERLVTSCCTDDNEEDHYSEADEPTDDWELGPIYDVGITTLCVHLESVCFQQFIGKPREMRWVKLFLKNAKPLHTMIISYGTDTPVCCSKFKSKEELIVEIPSFPRASSSCMFKFSSFRDSVI